MESLDYYSENRSDNEQTFYHALKKKVQKYFWVFFQLFFHTAYPYPKDEKIASKWLNLRVISKFYRASNLAKNKFEKNQPSKFRQGNFRYVFSTYFKNLFQIPGFLLKPILSQRSRMDLNKKSLSKPKTTTA